MPAEEAEPGKRAKFLKAMYGTRDGAHTWEWAYRTARESWGFVMGKTSHCVMHHPAKEIRIVVRGDDFALGEAKDWTGIVSKPPLGVQPRSKAA